VTALALRRAGWEARLLPDEGAAFAALLHDGRDLLVPIPPGGRPNRGFWGAFWMIPWANRLDGGALPFGGRTHRLPINRPDDRTAIHGLARDRPWRVESAGAERAVLAQTLAEPGIPFRYTARVAVALVPEGLSLEAAVTNESDESFPFGMGWHPFFPRPPGTRLRFSASVAFGRDPRTLPVEPRGIAGISGGEDAFVGLDTHFAGWDGAAEIAWPELALRLRATGALATNLQVFAPPFAPVLCVEPQSHVPDVPNRPALAAHGPLLVLAPGRTIAGSVAISVAPDATNRGTLAAK
jgi:aldose 1-epimerase